MDWAAINSSFLVIPTTTIPLPRQGPWLTRPALRPHIEGTLYWAADWQVEPFCTCLQPKKPVLRFEDSADFCIGQLDTRPVEKLTTSSATESLFSVERKKVEVGLKKNPAGDRNQIACRWNSSKRSFRPKFGFDRSRIFCRPRKKKSSISVLPAFFFISTSERKWRRVVLRQQQ